MVTQAGDLAAYLSAVIRDRRLSIRAFARYAGLSYSTVHNMLAGKPSDAKTLERLAAYLNLPASDIFRMAGLLPEKETPSELVRLIEHLFPKLPESDQQEIIDIIQMKISRQRKDSQGGQ